LPRGCERALELEKQESSLGNLDTIGEITIGCALGYSSFATPTSRGGWAFPGSPPGTRRWWNLAPLAETMSVGWRGLRNPVYRYDDFPATGIHARARRAIFLSSSNEESQVNRFHAISGTLC